MSDNYKGYDMTSILNEVARKHYDRNFGPGKDPEAPAWEDLPSIIQFRFRNDVLQLVTDTLDAAVEHHASTGRTTKMIPYGYTKGDRKDPRWYENQHPEQHDTSTATVWTLHVRLGPDEVARALDILQTHQAVTGEYTYEGDSFKEWGTPTPELDDQHFAVYFRSTPADAYAVGEEIAAWFTNDSEFYVSTSGDYAEQVHR